MNTDDFIYVPTPPRHEMLSKAIELVMRLDRNNIQELKEGNYLFSIKFKISKEGVCSHSGEIVSDEQ